MRRIRTRPPQKQQASKQASEELSKQIMNDALSVGWWLLLVAPRAIDEGLGQRTGAGGQEEGIAMDHAVLCDPTSRNVRSNPPRAPGRLLSGAPPILSPLPSQP